MTKQTKKSAPVAGATIEQWAAAKVRDLIKRSELVASVVLPWYWELLAFEELMGRL